MKTANPAHRTRILRACVGVVLSVSLTVLSVGCHGNAGPTQQEAQTSGSPATPGTQQTNTSPVDPIVAAALSPEAERGAVVGTTRDPRTLTSSELQFGRSPKLDPTVTYQPGILIMEHGDTALRSMDSNGMIWHFDANAPQVDRIQSGAIIFATERCVGRVLQVQRSGNDVAVLLGPIQITDVIKKAHFVYDQPLDLNAVIAAPAPDLPVVFRQDVPKGAMPSASPGTNGAQTPEATMTSAVTRHYRLESVTYAVVTTAGAWKPFRIATYDARGRVRQRYLRRPMHDVVAQAPVPAGLPAAIPTGIPAPPAGIGTPQTLNVTGMAVYPCLIGCGGFGVQLKYDRNGVKVYANAVFFLHDPSLHFNVAIDDGIKTVGISLKGAGGFQVRFEMGADESFTGNIHQTGNVPFDISIPIFNFATPISVHLIQSLDLNTGFSARTSVLQAMIRFQACCELSVGYINGSWGGSTPNVSVDATNGNVSGVSVGINSLAFGLRQELLVGIGAFGFASGPYLALTTGISALKQASEAMVDCRQATLSMDFSAGVGWTLPKPVVSVINFFLGALNVPPMSGSGSFLEMKPQRMVTYKGSLPKHCAG